MANARQEKFRKYAMLVTARVGYPRRYLVQGGPLVIGARGAWDPKNDPSLKDLVYRDLPRSPEEVHNQFCD